jgi:hypothetical protein
VQSGQAQIGEILISGYSNEDPVFGIDSVPFLATSFADAEKLWKASRKPLEERFAKQGMKVLYAVPWPPRASTQQADRERGRHEGPQDARLQPRHRQDRGAGGAQPVTCRPPSSRRR